MADDKDEYIAPPVENSIPLPIPAPPPCCLAPTTTLPLMEEISEEPVFSCEDLDSLLREVDCHQPLDFCPTHVL